MPFALDSEASVPQITEAVNYMLGNFSTGITSDPNTGQVKGPTGNVISYLYKYIAVKYADSFDGSVNFSNSPTGRQYYGIRNNDDPAESSNPADYIWYKASGGFGGTKSLWYVSTGGRQIQFAVSVSAPDSGWLVDPGSSIDLDVVTSGNIPVIAETFVAYFTPTILQVPRTGSPLAPVFTGIVPVMYATDKGAVVPFTDAQTDTAAGFVNNSWRIGNSSTTGFADISYTNITIGSPTDAGDYAQWPTPTAMPNSPAYITVPVRYKNSLGVVTQAGVATLQLVYADPGATGQQGSSLDISGYTSFTQNPGGVYTPATATLSAVLQNVTAPTYSWTISGATPTSATTSSVVVTPNSSATSVSVSLTVNGSNLATPLTKTMTMPVVYDGAPGAAGANGVMSAFPSIYIWTGSSAVPTRPTTTSTYTWSTGAYTAPSGWSTTAPSNTTAGNYLWVLTYPLTTSATTTTSTLDWTDVANPIRAIAYNGSNGANGTNGTNGTNGSNGAATFVVTRTANDSSPPTNAEVSALLGRNPVAGDICTVSYNNFNNAVVYRYTTSWSLFQTYITGSLIVQNTITADKMVTNLLSSDNVLTRGLTVRDNSGNIILSAGQNLDYSRVIASSGWLNSNVSINANGTLSGAGSGQVTINGLDSTVVRASNPINTGNVSTYIGAGAIGNAYIGNFIQSANFNGTIDSNGNITNYGTTGWAIGKGGSAALNSALFRGDIQTDGDAYFSGNTASTYSVLVNGTSYPVDYSAFGVGATSVPGGHTANRVRAAVLGRANSVDSTWNIGVVGSASGGFYNSNGIGVFGVGDKHGGYFSGNSTSDAALIAEGATSGAPAFNITRGIFLWNGYSIAAPSGNTSLFLRNDGTWATATGGGGGTVTSVSGTGNVYGLTLSGTVTTSGSLTLGGSFNANSIPISAINLSGQNIVARLLGTSGATSGVTDVTFSGTLTGGASGTISWTMGTSTAAININVTSDQRLKKDIKDLSFGLDFIKKLRPVEFKWNHELFAHYGDKQAYGFLANEVESIVGENTTMVTTIQQGPLEGYKSFSNDGIVSALVKAVQELTAKVESLEAQLQASK